MANEVYGGIPVGKENNLSKTVQIDMPDFNAQITGSNHYPDYHDQHVIDNDIGTYPERYDAGKWRN